MLAGADRETESSPGEVHQWNAVKGSSTALEQPAHDLDSEVRLTLVAGFLTGFAIGGIFLVYVVLSGAKLLEWPAL